MYLVNILFKNETIRIVWDKEIEKLYISGVDIISKSKDNRKY